MTNKLRTLLFTLGSTTAVVAPIAAVVACGSTKDTTTSGLKLETNTTGTTMTVTIDEGMKFTSEFLAQKVKDSSRTLLQEVEFKIGTDKVKFDWNNSETSVSDIKTKIENAFKGYSKFEAVLDSSSQVATPTWFDFKSDLAKFVDAKSTLLKPALQALTGAKTAAEMGYTEPTLSNGVTASYVVSANSVTVTLHYGSQSVYKVFNLTGVNPLDVDFTTPSMDVWHSIAKQGDPNAVADDQYVGFRDGSEVYSVRFVRAEFDLVKSKSKAGVSNQSKDFFFATLSAIASNYDVPSLKIEFNTHEALVKKIFTAAWNLAQPVPAHGIASTAESDFDLLKTDLQSM